MKFACLVYHEQTEAISETELTAIVEECPGTAAWMKAMRKDRHHVFRRALDPSRPPDRTNRDGRVCITDGPFAETKRASAG